MLERGLGEEQLADLYFQVRWFRVAAFVESVARLVWVFGSCMHRFKQFQALYLGCSAHVMALVCVKLLNLIHFAIWPFQLNLLAEVVHLRWVALLHDDLDHMFPLKLAVSEHWHKLDNDLHH